MLPRRRTSHQSLESPGFSRGEKSRTTRIRLRVLRSTAGYMHSRQCYSAHGGKSNEFTNTHVRSVHVDRGLCDDAGTLRLPRQWRQAASRGPAQQDADYASAGGGKAKRTAHYRGAAFSNTMHGLAPRKMTRQIERDSTGLWSLGYERQAKASMCLECSATAPV